MQLKLTNSRVANYWLDDGWFVGAVDRYPDVFSQGESLTELRLNLLDAYQFMHERFQQQTTNNQQLRFQ